MAGRSHLSSVAAGGPRSLSDPRVSSPGSSTASTDDARGFLVLDAILKRADASGLLLVQTPETTLDAIAAHAVRRARGTGRAVISVGRTPLDDAMRELTMQLAGYAVTEPLAAAEALMSGLAGGVAVVLDRAPSAWGAAVLDALSASMSQSGDCTALVVVIACRTSRVHDALQVEGSLGPEESRAFWEAIAFDAERTISPRFQRLDALERWWSAARADRSRDVVATLSAPARRLLARIALSERAWHPSDLIRLGSAEAREELLAFGAIEVDDRARSAMIAPGFRDHSCVEPDAADALAVASALEHGIAPLHGEPRNDNEPWALMRAAELYASVEEANRAEAAAMRALSIVADPDARSDFWSRWNRAQATLPKEDALGRLLRAADMALRVGDADQALELARSATSQAGNTYDATLLLGRAMAARGDLTTALLALTRAMDVATDTGARARAAVEIAEVHYVAGRIDESRSLADSALAGASDDATRLKARNVLGKLLLDRARWSEAEQHFAADAWEAACAGNNLAELRARLNRAIALMSNDRRDEARTMLATVLTDGETQGQLRAVCFALANLAIIALGKHEYADALSLSERSIVFARRLGDKVLLAHIITNLAELRLDLGLIAESEQALAFGRKACAAVVASRLASDFARVAARIHLARGRTLEATAEIKTALGAAETSRSGSHLALCHRVAARIALEEGDVTRTIASLANAKLGAASTKERAETVLLEAMLAQAMGEPYDKLASEVLDLTGQSDNWMIGIEAHVLLHQAHAEDDPVAARSHLEMAIALRDRAADTLPIEVRARFIARRELKLLAKLEAEMDRSEPPGGTTTFRSVDSADSIAKSLPPRITLPPGGGERRIVGRDPSIVALLGAVQKIGPATSTVLIHGESGTGKELIAEAIHRASDRKGGPLVKVNCAALVETLLLSELFGHEKGAFTGALQRRRGRFEMAEGGTLFLDEIGDISPRTQVALLRVLQDRTFERVGGVTPLRANVRVITATHRDLKAMVARGQFREDLYFRLAGVVLEVPALRHRIGDLPAISEAILARIAAEHGTAPKKLSDTALSALAAHHWPGNVRELDNVLRAASLFAEGDVIELRDLAANIDTFSNAQEPDGASVPPQSLSASTGRAAPGHRSTRPSAPSFGGPQQQAGTISAPDEESSGATPSSLSKNAQTDSSDPTEIAYVHIRSGVSLHDLKRSIERECILRALQESKGNISRAAVLLGMKRPRLSQLVKQYGFGGVSEEEA